MWFICRCADRWVRLTNTLPTGKCTYDIKRQYGCSSLKTYQYLNTLCAFVYQIVYKYINIIYIFQVYTKIYVCQDAVFIPLKAI